MLLLLWNYITCSRVLQICSFYCTFVFFLLITLLRGPIGFEILRNWTFNLLLVTIYGFNGFTAISSKDSFWDICCFLDSWPSLSKVMHNWFSNVFYLNWSLFVEILRLLRLLIYFVFKNIFGIWASPLFMKIFWSRCGLYFVEAGHNLLLVSNNLINNFFLTNCFSAFLLRNFITCLRFV